MPRRALGKGLSALIPELDRKPDDGRRIVEIPLTKIEPNPFQPRMDFDKAGIEELKNSILAKGVIQPIIVKKAGDRYQIIAGERRVRAVKEAGFDTIPALVMDVGSSEEMLELALVENVQREDLNPVDEARAYRVLMERYNFTQEEVSKRVGKDRSTVANLMRLLKLCPEVQERLVEGQISMGHARALLPIDDERLQVELCEKAIKQRWSVRKIEKAAKSTGVGQKTRDVRQQSPIILSIEDELRRVFGTAVRIRKGRKKGTIEIEFYSDDDLERVIDILRDRSPA